MHTWAKLCHLAMRKAVKARRAKFSNLGQEETQSKQGHRTHGVGANDSHAECDAAISEADEE
jgi:hypothetical protein